MYGASLFSGQDREFVCKFWDLIFCASAQTKNKRSTLMNTGASPVVESWWSPMIQSWRTQHNTNADERKINAEEHRSIKSKDACHHVFSAGGPLAKSSARGVRLGLPLLHYNYKLLPTTTTTTTTTTYYYYYLLLPTTTYYYLLLPTTAYYYLLLPTTTYYYLLLLLTTTNY